MCTTDGEILRSEVERSLSLCHTHHANSKIRYTQWTLRIASVSVGFCVVVKPSLSASEKYENNRRCLLNTMD